MRRIGETPASQEAAQDSSQAGLLDGADGEAGDGPVEEEVAEDG
jgi:hypothetical protein